jgi:hypothetical protein
MNTDQCEAWHDFVAELAWLARSHRALLEVASVLRARFFTNPDVGVACLQVLSAVLSKLGATPVDEGRVGWAGDDGPDEMFDA